MKNHLAVLYTNNNISLKVFQKVLYCYGRMISNPSLIFNTKAVVVSSLPVLNLPDTIDSLIAPSNILSKGHLSIIEKILLAVDCYNSDYISLHEHDMLYPDNYLVTIQNIIDCAGRNFDYIAYNNLFGVNKSGYLGRVIKDFPFSTLTFSKNALKDLLLNKRQEYLQNGNWCFLEPGYGNSYGLQFQRLELGSGAAEPAVHINMNLTNNNHHLTNHYLTYESISRIGFSMWPGDLSYIFD